MRYNILPETLFSGFFLFSGDKQLANFTIIKKFQKKTKIRCVCGEEFYTKNRLDLKNPCQCEIKDSKSQEFNTSYNIYKNGAKERNIDFKLLPEHFEHLIGSICFYCDAPPRMYSEGVERVGIDRTCNSVGYLPHNVIACCSRCNKGKGEMDLDEYEEYISKVYHNLKKYRAFDNKDPQRNLFIFKRGYMLAGSHVIRLLDMGLITKEEVRYDITKTLTNDHFEAKGFTEMLIEIVAAYAGNKKAKSKVMKTPYDKIEKLYAHFLQNKKLDHNLVCKLILNREIIPFDKITTIKVFK